MVFATISSHVGAVRLYEAFARLPRMSPEVTGATRLISPTPISTVRCVIHGRSNRGYLYPDRFSQASSTETRSTPLPGMNGPCLCNHRRDGQCALLTQTWALGNTGNMERWSTISACAVWMAALYRMRMSSSRSTCQRLARNMCSISSGCAMGCCGSSVSGIKVGRRSRAGDDSAAAEQHHKVRSRRA